MKCKNVVKGIFFAMILTALLAATASAACIGVGTVKDDGLRLRTGVGTQYEILTTANAGDTVVVLEEEDGWYKVDFGTQTGYMSGGYVSVATSAEVDLGLGMVTTKGTVLNVRTGAGTGYNVITKLSDGTVVDLKGVSDGWYKIAYGDISGYVSSDYITRVLDKTGARKDGNNVTVASQGSDLGQRIVNEARKHVGKRYVYGAKGPDCFDCSGFAYYCVKQASGGSIILSGGSTNQWKTAPGKRIYSINELQAGDLFFICDPAYSGGKATSHVAIYAGNGQMIHASNSRTGVVSCALRDKDYRYFVGGVRLG